MTEEEKDRKMNEELEKAYKAIEESTPLGKEESMKNELILKVFRTDMKIAILNSLDYEALKRVTKNENFRLFNNIYSTDLEEMIANRKDKEEILKNKEILEGLRN